MGDKKHAPDYTIAAAQRDDIPEIVALINTESELSGAVLKVSEGQVADWIRNGMSMVAKLPDGSVIGHLSAHRWPKSGWVELRSSVVMPEYRGFGVSSAVNASMLKRIAEKYGKTTLVAFTNKAGTGKGILAAAGFRDADYDTLPKELFSIGPAYRGKKEYGYRIFTMKL